MAETPTFAGTVNIGLGTISTANTNRDGTGTVVTIFTAGANGSLIQEIVIQATGTVTAGVVRLFLHDGSNYFLWYERLVTATTPSTTVAAFRDAFRPCEAELDGFPLEAGWTIRASTHNAEGFKVIIVAGDF